MKKPFSIFLLLLLAGSSFAALLPVALGASSIIAQNTAGSLSAANNISTSWQQSSGTAAIGQGFITPNDGVSYYLTSIQFVINKNGAPTGHIKAVIADWDSGTTYPKAPYWRATSDAFDIGAIGSGTQWVTFTFSGSNRYQFAPNTRYTFSVIWDSDFSANGGSVGANYYSASGYDGSNSKSFLYYNGAWTLSVNSLYDRQFKVYAAATINNVVNDVVGKTTIERPETTTLYTHWYATGDAGVTLSQYQFSINTGSGYANDDWANFAVNNNSWANRTLDLGSVALGTVVYWKVTAKNTAGDITTTPEQSFTVQATVTFYFNEGGAFYRDSVSIANGSSIVYTSTAAHSLLAVVNSGYGWLSWNWSQTSATDNPYSWQPDNKTSVWCYFVNATAAGGGETIVYVTPPPPRNYSISLTLEALFFGSVWYFGFLIFLVVSLIVLWLWKFAGAIIIPVAVIFEAAYYRHLATSPELVWAMVFLGFLVLGVAAYSIDAAKSRHEKDD